MNETSNTYHPKLSRFERRNVTRSKKIKARKNLMREALAK